MLPVLELTGDQLPHKTNDVVRDLAIKKNLTIDEINELLPSGKQKKFHNRVAWAISYLYQAGLIRRPTRGFIQIADLGLKELKNSPSHININYLKKFESFEEFRNRTKVEDDVHIGSEESVLELKTPTEIFDKSYKEIRLSLEKELLEKTKAASPSFFETVVVELLIAMGYGGSYNDVEEAVVGNVGDGGIDGIIKEDKLGLDNIYVQAKRWNGSVGRPDVQSFSGALDGKGAHKGVMITTSTFSPEAKKYVQDIRNKKIVLIEGVDLSKLMIDHDLGVTTSQTYSIKKIDHDYFEEE